MMQKPSDTPELAWWCDVHIQRWCQSITRWSNCTIWSSLARVSRSETWSQRLGHAKSSVLFLPSLNLLYQSKTAVRCKESLPYTHFIQKWMCAILHLLRTETGWCSTVCDWTNLWQLSTVQTLLRAVCLWWCLSWSVVTTDHCQTAQEWSTLHYTEPDNTRCLFILQQTLYFCSGSHNKMSITLKQWTSSPRKHTDVSQGVCWWGMWLYC